MHETVERAGLRIDLAGDLPRRHGGRGALLLQDDVVPAAGGQRLQQFLIRQVTGEAFAAFEEARAGDLHLLRRGDLLHDGRHVVVIGIAVANPEYAQRIGVFGLPGEGQQQEQQNTEEVFCHIVEVFRVFGRWFSPSGPYGRRRICGTTRRCRTRRTSGRGPCRHSGRGE